MITSTAKNTSTSPSDDHSKTRVTDKNQTCVHCGDPAGYLPKPHQQPDFPDTALLCQSCGNKNTDSLGFYVVDKEKNRLASPEFSTLGEAKQFADLFYMTSYSSYDLSRTTYLFNGQRDEQARRAYQARVGVGRQILTLLVELLNNGLEPDDLTTLVVLLKLNNCALPRREG
jgi:hypothetical protein